MSEIQNNKRLEEALENHPNQREIVANYRIIEDDVVFEDDDGI